MHRIQFDKLKEIVEDWARNIEPRIRIYLFGSRAKGTASDSSDIDLAIEFLERIPKDQMDDIIICDGADLEQAIRKAMNKKVCLEDYENRKVKEYVKGGFVIIYESKS